ncbi:MAG: hypothetical protein RIR48_596, partial [Bacteroidota bacterium]
TMQGPDLMESISLIGLEECGKRIISAISHFDEVVSG